MNITKVLETRYSTKLFNLEKKIDTETWAQIEDTLRLSPSSINIQPWHFVITSTEEGKARMLKGTVGAHDYNNTKITAASHVVLFASKTEVSEEYLQQLLEKEDSDGRYEKEGSKEMMSGGRSMFVNLHKDTFQDLPDWLEKQTYINIGSTLLAAGVLGVDAVPMEGIDVSKLNEEFGLTEKGLTATAMVAFGYRTEDDFNAKIPKSRLAPEDIFTRV